VSERVIIDPDVEGLGMMLADLIRGNLEAEPARASLLEGHPATVNLHVHDAEVGVGLEFTGSAIRIGSVVEKADMTIATDAESLMELTNVPLRFGMPDQLTAKGRVVAGKLLRGEIKVEGLPKQLMLMIRLQRLFTVA